MLNRGEGSIDEREASFACLLKKGDYYYYYHEKDLEKRAGEVSPSIGDVRFQERGGSSKVLRLTKTIPAGGGKAEKV